MDSNNPGGPGEPGDKGLDLGEIIDKFPSLLALFMATKQGIEEAQTDGKLTGEELGQILGNLMRPLGRLVDEVIADAND